MEELTVEYLTTASPVRSLGPKGKIIAIRTSNTVRVMTDEWYAGNVGKIMESKLV